VTSWLDLRAALDGAAERGEAIRLWWRTTTRARPLALTRLLDLADCHGLPWRWRWCGCTEANGHARIAASRHATVLQHGFAHIMRRPAADRPSSADVTWFHPGGAGERPRLLADAFGCASWRCWCRRGTGWMLA
jgi:hypothetical protein